MFMSDVSAAEIQPPPIVVTASRTETEQAEIAASVTVIERERIDRLGEPLAVSLLRQVPSVSVSTSGPAGSTTAIRIRGGEARHTLLFIDGIRANDPAAGNVPRFELLNADLASRIEVVRGPQSALWGPEAIGGVVAVEGSRDETSRALAEGGSFGFARAAASAGAQLGGLVLNVGAGLQRASGIDAFDGGSDGEKDGYRNLALRGTAAWQAAPHLELAASAFAIAGRSQFDGYDSSFARADTLDNASNRLVAGRLSGKWAQGPWIAEASASHLRSVNINRLDDALVNRTAGDRTSGDVQLERQITTGQVKHSFVVALDADRETYRSRNPVDAAAEQDRSRSRAAVVGEWRATFGSMLVTDIALRHDRFERFKDATTVRASALVTPAQGLQLAISYGEGIAQPTFVDLYGYYPGIFTGNPDLRPERSRGGEVAVRYATGPFSAGLTLYRQRLTDEIVNTFFTAVNAAGTSKRRGVEAELGWRPASWLNLSASYAYLQATQQIAAADPREREVRRPRHSAGITADGESGRLTYGAALSFTGARTDKNFDVFPAPTVRLGSYWLAGARIAYRVSPNMELFGRIANGFDADYQDVFGYRTEGRSAHAGIRVGLGR